MEVEPKEKIIKKVSKWTSHVRAHRLANPDKSYKQCLIDSKKDYVK